MYHLSRKFRERILYYGCVDTRCYRYVVHFRSYAGCPEKVIIRLPVKWLDTTIGLNPDDWELVEIVEVGEAVCYD